MITRHNILGSAALLALMTTMNPAFAGPDEALAKLAGYGLLGTAAPAFVALPALPVSHANLLDAWTQVYSTEATDNIKSSMAN